jgi:hypothetical protein
LSPSVHTYFVEHLRHRAYFGGHLAAVASAVSQPQVYAKLSETTDLWNYALRLGAGFRLAFEDPHSQRYPLLMQRLQQMQAGLTPLQRSLIWSAQLLAMTKACEVNYNDREFGFWLNAARRYAINLDVDTRFSKMPYQGISLWTRGRYELLSVVPAAAKWAFWRAIYDPQSPLVVARGSQYVVKKMPYEVVEGWLVPYMPCPKLARRFALRPDEQQSLVKELSLRLP